MCSVLCFDRTNHIACLSRIRHNLSLSPLLVIFDWCLFGYTNHFAFAFLLALDLVVPPSWFLLSHGFV